VVRQQSASDRLGRKQACGKSPASDDEAYPARRARPYEQQPREDIVVDLFAELVQF
jgi:hypothetical protein